MNETKEVSTRPAPGVEVGDSKREKVPAIQPPMDIYEDKDGITVVADMPGVSRERLQINVDSDRLTIEGRVDVPVSEGMSALYADVRSTRYERSFTLSRELDADNAEANLSDGLLTLRIPKRAEHKPRKIEIRGG